MNAARSFTFGRNWKNFLRFYTPERQKVAQDALLGFLKLPDLKEKTFLDIGCGSGLHSAAAFLSGASRIVSFDYDPDSVAATRKLREHLGSPEHWSVMQGSALDEEFMKLLGAFDIVYSWGVLHHTGDQWRALGNACKTMHEMSRLYIALYAKELQVPNCEYWIDVKKRYNASGRIGKLLMEADYIWKWQLDRDWRKIPALIKKIGTYRFERGMEFMTDIRDWLGGWPMEFSSTPEVMDFVKNHFGLALVNFGFGEACSEYLFVHEEKADILGYKDAALFQKFHALPQLEDVKTPFDRPVWLFGAAQGAALIYEHLREQGVAVAGFIDIVPQKQFLHNLPVCSFAAFVKDQPKTTPVIQTTRYVVENLRRLHEAGFQTVYDATRLVKRLNAKREIA
jgi:2-polyprenyl-6-hydroxyphenyl methylase/3-demethylubiquinone-9 3-methyltransferase